MLPNKTVYIVVEVNADHKMISKIDSVFYSAENAYILAHRRNMEQGYVSWDVKVMPLIEDK